LGGIVFGVSILKRNRYIGLVKPYEVLIYYFMDICPVMQFLLSLLLMIAWILFNYRKTVSNLEDRQYNAVCFDEENNLNENGENNVNLEFIGRLRRVQSFINRILSHKFIKNIKLFNDIFAPRLILCFIFLNSFYVGLGFDAF
jgi:hypothetical protein